MSGHGRHFLERNKIPIAFLWLILLNFGCVKQQEILPQVENSLPDSEISSELIQINEDISLGQYFSWIDSIVLLSNEDSENTIDEYTLVHANPWIIDSLAATDYYAMKSQGKEVTDLLGLKFIKKGSEVIIPNREKIDQIKKMLSEIVIDVNIPEYKLRVFQGQELLHEFSIRVGRNERKFLAMAKHFVDLRTKTGEGEIVRIAKNASFINPVDNKRYYSTRRDDNISTSLPNIPWLEPEIDGIRHGQLIHPTTNLKTLGHAYSNGCIGLRESDAWRLYYYAPLGTKVQFRYNLDVPDQKQKLKDIYKRAN